MAFAEWSANIDPEVIRVEQSTLASRRTASTAGASAAVRRCRAPTEPQASCASVRGWAGTRAMVYPCGLRRTRS